MERACPVKTHCGDCMRAASSAISKTTSARWEPSSRFCTRDACDTSHFRRTTSACAGEFTSKTNRATPVCLRQRCNACTEASQVSSPKNRAGSVKFVRPTESSAALLGRRYRLLRMLPIQSRGPCRANRKESMPSPHLHQGSWEYRPAW